MIIEKIKVYLLRDNPISSKIQLKKLYNYLNLIDPNRIKSIIERRQIVKLSRTEQIIPNEIEKSVNTFVDRMKTNLSEEKTKNLVSNIDWVEIRILGKFGQSEILGQYYSKKNKIELHKISSIYHELFHLSANDININDTSNGFYYDLNDCSIGEGLNEGYIEVLVERYFEDETKEQEEIYSFEKKCAKVLEEIVGQENMETLFFNQDLLGLISILKNYYSSEEIIEFLTIIDVILAYRQKSVVGNKEFEIINSKFQKVICFLIKGKCIKLSNQNNTLEHNTNVMKETLSNINVHIDFGLERFTEVDIDSIVDIMTTYLGDNIDLEAFKTNKNVL